MVKLFIVNPDLDAQVGTNGWKNIDWININNRLMAEHIDYIDGSKKKILGRWIDIISQTYKIFTGGPVPSV